MNKCYISILLSILLLFTTTLPVQAAGKTVRIDDARDLLTLAEDCRLDRYSEELTVILTADIDLTATDFDCIPIFCGVFEGNGHTISGLSILDEGSVQGLFRYLTETAVVQNLHIEGEIAPAGSRSTVGAVAGSNAGYIFNCSFTGSLSGGDYVGGIVGSNSVTGIIENCTVEGDIHGSHFVGGITGLNQGVIRNCRNLASINITAQQNTVDLSEITLDTLTSVEAADTVTDIGGIAGGSSGVIRSCTNRGSVGYQHMGYNIGGIAGSQTGYIYDCTNYGAIAGRKDVGGIVGQMEPVNLIEYSTDTLQILQGQLDDLSILADQAMGRAQVNISGVNSQVGALRSQAQAASDAVASLIPDPDNPQLPDTDSILAAGNTLNSNISAMPGTLNSLASSLQNTASSLTYDIQQISNQLDVMGATLQGASENLGGSISDVSDEDTSADFSSKTENCYNYANILADLNAGGIVGAMALENDLDHEEDLQISGDTTLHFESQLRTVVLDCDNHGDITLKRYNAGGIVGWQSMGLVKNSCSTGDLDNSGAAYVGGISGRSTGYIRGCSTKCRIVGDSYVGGIAGSATIISDCRSLTDITGREKTGGIIGLITDAYNNEETPITGNYFMKFTTGVGAIDHIDYAGCAEGLDSESFLALEDLPDLFDTAVITFRFADGAAKILTVDLGTELSTDLIPEVPTIDGSNGYWDHLAQTDLSHVYFDLTFQAAYIDHQMTIESTISRDGVHPLLLIQGDFVPDTTLIVAKCDDSPKLADNMTLAEVWSFEASYSKNMTTGRFHLSDSMDPDSLKVFTRTGYGDWNTPEYRVDGSYIVFDLLEGDDAIAIVQLEQTSWLLPVAAGICTVLVGIIIFAIVLKKKK